MNYPVIILGAGGHARVLIDALRLQSVELLGMTDADIEKKDQLLLGVRVLGGDEEVNKYPVGTIRLVNGLGSVGYNSHRRYLFECFKKAGNHFVNVIHPSAVLAFDVVLAEGVQIMAGSVVQVGSYIGINTIVNTRAVVDHDCHIGDHAHIAPGVILSGGVIIGDGAHLGTGATVIQGIRIGANSLIAAGAVVIRDVPDGATVMGVPAVEVRTNA